MPNLHDIERRIKSVESTKQVTHTMQMVAAAKIRHATERCDAATPFANAMRELCTPVIENSTHSAILVVWAAVMPN